MSSLLLIVCGLVLFLYALNTLSEGLKAIAGERLKTFLERFTRNLFRGILSGIIVTLLLDSSSVVIIMTIALVNAGTLSFRQAMGVVMGANIGTAFSSQLFALDVGEYAAIPILAGFLLMFFMERPFYRHLGRVIFSFGLIFFGLFTMEQAVEPLKDSRYFVGWLQSLESTWKGLYIGALVTVVVQSSSATMGMVIGLAAQKLMTLPAALAVLLGAELGTCADTILASVGRSRAAVKTGLFQLLFNISTIAIAMLLLPYFTSLTIWLSAGLSLQRAIANAHLLFNVFGVIVMLPFVGAFEQVLNRWVGGVGIANGQVETVRE